jgi:ABC-type Mn2+/Zn2+ transport system ATPase subunit
LVVDHQATGPRLEFDDTHEWVNPTSHSTTSTRPRISIAPLQDNGDVTWRIDEFALPDQPMIRDLTLILPPGGMIVIHGGNGTGKSTLLRALAGLRQPYQGVTTKLAFTGSMDNILLSPQPPKLVPELPATSNLTFMLGRGAAVSTGEWDSAAATLGWFGISRTCLKKRAELLSGGEAAAVALVGALLGSAPLVFLDEPFESLSPEATAKGLRLLEQARRAGKRLVTVSHYPLISSAPGARLRLGDSEVRDLVVCGVTPPGNRQEAVQ